jgi:hypothetical protein
MERIKVAFAGRDMGLKGEHVMSVASFERVKYDRFAESYDGRPCPLPLSR